MRILIMKPTLKSGLAICALLPLSSCVTWHQYETTLRRADRYESLARLRADTIDRTRATYLATSRENEQLVQRNRLLQEELGSSRTQYTQLAVANSDVLARYDRSLDLATRGGSGLPSPQTPALGEGSLDLPGLQSVGDRSSRRDYEGPHRQSSGSPVVETRLSEQPVRSQPIPSEALASSAGLTHEVGRSHSEEIYLAMKSAIVGFTSKEASVVRQRDFVVVRLSEHLLFPTGQDEVSSLGLAALRQIASVLEADRGTQAIVYAQSRREGSATALEQTNATLSKTLGETLLLQGAEPGQIAVDASGSSSYKVEPAGELGSALDGQLVLLIRERDFRAGAGMFGVN